jgi:hypothetical protein
MAPRMPFRRVPVQITDKHRAVVYSGRMTQRQWNKWCHAAREYLNVVRDLREVVAELEAERAELELSDATEDWMRTRGRRQSGE